MTRASKPTPQPIANVATASPVRAAHRCQSSRGRRVSRSVTSPRSIVRGRAARSAAIARDGAAGHAEDAREQVAGAAGHDPERDARSRRARPAISRSVPSPPMPTTAATPSDDGGVDGRSRLGLRRRLDDAWRGYRRAARARPGPRRRAPPAAPSSRSREPNGLTMTRLRVTPGQRGPPAARRG